MCCFTRANLSYVESSTGEENPFYLGNDVESSITTPNPNYELRSDSYDSGIKMT